ncbi:MAG TPA: AAA family ATPase [Phycisphaerae bacterium]|nr:AAA family ATPase [Phycisphaerae bacterium]
MRVIAIFNHKGGCGKTTTAINLAAALAAAKRRVLLVDLDPQAHATVGCGVREQEVELSMRHVLGGEGSGNGPLAVPDIAWEILEGLYLAPSSVGLASLEQTLAGADGRDRRLKELISQVDGRYDFVLIDSGPGLGILSINALMAAGEVLVPVDLGFFSIYGLGRVVQTIDMIGERTGHAPAFSILATMYDTRARTMRRALAALRDQYAGRVLDTVIHFNVDLREAAAMGSPILEFRPGSRGHTDYRALAQEVLSAGLQVEYETLAQQETETFEREERAVDEKVEAVYGAVVTEGGVRFVCHAPDARRVQVAGDFNSWGMADGETEMTPTDQTGVWRKEIRVGPGRYAYRLIIDGRWCSDPANPYVESNPYGELNSVVEVQ